jgi:heme-degrading monooxygenase HmoA
MFARNVSIRLKPNSSVAFRRQIESHTVPLLRKQKGFEGEITFLSSGGTDAVAITFWDSRENADAYAKTAYQDILNNLNEFIEGTPKVQIYEVTNSTLHSAVATEAR